MARRTHVSSSPRRTPGGVVLLIALGGAMLAAAGASHAESLALLGATVHPVSGPPLDGATVLIEDGRISGVGAGLAVPAGARRIDLSGQQLYPGLIDANTVLGLVEIGAVKATRDYSEIGGINPNERAEVAVNPSSELIPVTRSGGVLMAMTAARRGLIPGLAALIVTDGWTWEEMTLAAPVGLLVNWPGMRVDRTLRPVAKVDEQIEQRERRIRSIGDAFAEARAYWRARDAGAGDARDRDVKWEAMRPFVRGELPVIVQANDLLQIRAALDWAESEELRLVIAGGADAWRIGGELAARDVPVILRRVAAMPMRRYEPYDTPYATAARLHEAGVRIAFATGASGFGAANARNLPLHAALAVAYGLPPAAAVRALTLGAAEIFGVDDRVGSIEVGKEATLIATDGEVLDARAHVTRAWIAGRAVDLRDKHRRLYEVYDARPRP